MSELADFWVHTVTVRTVTGTGGMGTTYAAPAPVPCFVEEKRRLVRAPDGAQVVSEATVYAPAGTTALSPGSLVALPSGRTATVITSSVLDGGDLDLPDHVAAALT